MRALKFVMNAVADTIFFATPFISRVIAVNVASARAVAGSSSATS